ncbi:MAG: DUF4339 domain-containing protein [Planctomycetaceae bacterium]|nr:DUF4339 domain-containing protein [Planctomycetaceae bacterium]
MAGKRGKCPKCLNVFSLPGEAAAPAPASTASVPAAPQADQWYYSAEGNEHGPVSMSELLSLIRRGQLQTDHFVWKEGMEQWASVASVPELGTAAPTRRPQEPTETSQAEPAGQPVALAGATAGGAEVPISAAAPQRQAKPASRAAATKAAIGRQAMRVKEQMRGPFSQATGGYLGALRQMLKHPIKLAFLTFAYLILSLLAFGSILGMLLFPVFVMGYIMSIRNMVSGHPTAMADFIAFMRHGWDCLWHLIMLLASFFVTLATILAPAAIVLVILYVLFGTGGALISEATSHSSPSASDVSPSHNSAVPERRVSGSRLFSSAAETADEAMMLVLSLLVTVVVVTVIVTPLTAGLIMFFFLAIEVASRPPGGAERFALVYEGLKRMFSMAKRSWKQLLCCGLLSSAGFLACMAVPGLMSYLLAKMHLFSLAAWTVAVLLPLLMLSFQVHWYVYATITCTRLQDELE